MRGQLVLKKKELAELDAVLAELGLNDSNAQDDSRGHFNKSTYQVLDQKRLRTEMETWRRKKRALLLVRAKFPKRKRRRINLLETPKNNKNSLMSPRWLFQLNQLDQNRLKTCLDSI